MINKQNNEAIDYSQYYPDVHFELIPIKDLVSNQEYQRNLSVKHIRRTAANFDLYQLNPVKVSRRNNINYVFNGQHTIEIVALVSGSRDTPVWCMIYDDLIYEAEADIFANQAKFNKPLSPYEMFLANIEAGSDKHLIIKDLVESYDLIVSSVNQPCCICAVGSLEQVYDRYGFHVLDRVLRLIAGTWEGAPMSFSGSMIKGVAHLVYAFGDSMKDDVFKEKCGKESVKEISRDAKARRSGSLGYSEKLLMLYNKQSKSGLRLEKLYSEVRRAEKEYKDALDADEYAG